MNQFKKKVWLDKAKSKIKAEVLSFDNQKENTIGMIPFSQMVAMDIGAQYIASLNDREFFDLIQRAGVINDQQVQSLQRPYSTFDFRAEHKKHIAWDNIAKLQSIEVKREQQERKKSEKSKEERSFFDRILGR